jgi:hypothetical protein
MKIEYDLIEEIMKLTGLTGFAGRQIGDKFSTVLFSDHTKEHAGHLYGPRDTPRSKEPCKCKVTVIEIHEKEKKDED